MEKYSDVAFDIDNKFQEGINLLEKIVEEIENLITVFGNSSGGSVDSIVSDLKTVSEKYDSVIKIVKKRNVEIQERANCYDAYLNSAKQRMNFNNPRKYNKTENIMRKGWKEDKIVSIEGPNSTEDGLSYYLIVTLDCGSTWPHKEVDYRKKIGDKKEKIEGMSGFSGGMWNASDY